MEDYQTVEQLSRWLFEHKATIAVEDGLMPNSVRVRIQTRQPAEYNFERHFLQEDLDQSYTDLRTQAICMVWREADRAAGH